MCFGTQSVRVVRSLELRVILLFCKAVSNSLNMINVSTTYPQMKVVQLSEVPMFSDRQTRDKTIIKYDDPINLAPGACTTRGVTLMCCVPSRT